MGETGELNSVEAKLDLLVTAVLDTGDEVRRISANLGELVELAKAECTEAAGSPERKQEKKDDGEKKKDHVKDPKKKDEKREPKPPPPLPPPPKVPPPYFPYNVPVRSSATTIQRFSASLQRFSGTHDECSTPIAVGLGPYHHCTWQVREMEEVKRAAMVEFRRSRSQQCDAAKGKILSLVGSARTCYAGGQREFWCVMKDDEFAEMMFLDGWFLLQFMVSMFPDNPDASPDADLLMSRREVHTRISDIARDVMLLENQLPWIVIEALMELWPAGVPVDKFLRLMATAFHVGNQDMMVLVPSSDSPAADDLLLGRQAQNHDRDWPPHLLGLFYRRQVGAARTQSLRVPRLSSLSSTAVELAEMGVNITASKTQEFGDMSMCKRRPGFISLSGELSLAPLVLNDLTACWLVNMAAYEACLGATRADNFAVSSYVYVVALLMNREEDVQELRAKGIVHSAFSDMGTLNFFKGLTPHLHVGHRYYQVFAQLQEYKQDRWLWIAVHRFLYKNIKTIIAVLSVIGVLAGLFKTILSLKQPQP